MSKFTEVFASVASKLQTLSTVQKVGTAVAAAATVAVVGGGAVLLSSIGNDADVLGTESTETESTESYVEEVIGDVVVSIETSSIYQDLKVKVVDKEDNLVSGYPFVITVAKAEDYEELAEEVKDRTEQREADKEESSADKEEAAEDKEDASASQEDSEVPQEQGSVDIEGDEYTDDDMDGMIHIQEIEGTDYIIYLHSVEGIIPIDNLAVATVKGELEYKKVNNKNEIKKDDASEDTAENNVAVETLLVDTLPLLKTDRIPVKVSKDKVDTSSFPTVSVGESVSHVLTMEAGEQGGTGNDGGSNPPEGDAGNTEPGTDGSTEPDTDGSTEPSTDGSTEPATDQGSGTDTDGQSLEDESMAISIQALIKSKVKAGIVQTEQIKTAPASSATVSLPQEIYLYSHSDSEKKATLELKITGDSTIISSVNWDLGDSKVISATSAGTNAYEVTFKGDKSVTHVIKVSVKYWDSEADKKNRIESEVVLECAVKGDDYSGAGGQLKSTSGKLLYVDEYATTPATPGDYFDSNIKTFYTTPKYTGWWTIGDKLYYYKADGTPATGKQVIGGIQYEFNSDGSLKPSKQTYGIDVSKWQGNIDWKAVAQSGVKFAIIRCAYRGAANGQIHEDPYFKQNIKGATQNGIKVGVYFFTQAINEMEAIEEASVALNLVAGYKLQFPIFIDTENATNGRANGLDKATRTRVVKAFCEVIRNYGYKPGIYASKSWYNDKLDMKQLSTYNIWVAQYNISCNYTGRYDIWQYTSKGSVPGIKGNVDLNICYTGY